MAERSVAPEFVDECTVYVRGGDGGNGAVSFRREAHVPRGGPDGGDGGRGGDVVLVADPRVNSLLDLHRSRHRRAGRGGHGEGSDKTGADGADLLVPVPAGTVVRERASCAVLTDLDRPGTRFIVARGGRGGRGNASLASDRRRAPRFAELGERGEERSLRLELKVIADVGLVGFPSAGKSSLISRLSAARPRIEAWPFTTLTPHLGVMRAGDVDVVLADVPGLIGGASQGRGLGHRFLRHIERCVALVHVLDSMPFEPDRDPITDLEVILGELEAHDPRLLERPSVVALNKVDLPDGRAMAALVRPELEARGYAVFEVSAVSGQGLDSLRWHLSELVTAARARAATAGEPEELVIRLEEMEEAPLAIERDDLGRFVVSGRRVERWVQMTPLDNPEAVRYLQGRLRRGGVERALVHAGARVGDEVVIGGAVFDFSPEPDDLPEEEREATVAGEEDVWEDLPARPAPEAMDV
ncbi:MAG: GTPase ObgE [Actinomycetota bacterium]|nr:GTPase ObgE [Actinomycetota bacterium]